MNLDWKRAIGIVLICWGAMMLVMSALFVWLGASSGLDGAPIAFAVTWFAVIGMVAVVSTTMIVAGVWVIRRFRARDQTPSV